MMTSCPTPPCSVSGCSRWTGFACTVTPFNAYVPRPKKHAFNLTTLVSRAPSVCRSLVAPTQTKRLASPEDGHGTPEVANGETPGTSPVSIVARRSKSVQLYNTRNTGTTHVDELLKSCFTSEVANRKYLSCCAAEDGRADTFILDVRVLEYSEDVDSVIGKNRTGGFSSTVFVAGRVETKTSTLVKFSRCSP